jgi:hypothetical protein
MKIGLGGMLLGTVAFVCGLVLGNAASIAVGGLIFFGGAYTAIYAQVGSF